MFMTFNLLLRNYLLLCLTRRECSIQNSCYHNIYRREVWRALAIVMENCISLDRHLAICSISFPFMVWFSLPYICYVQVRWIHCFHIFKKDEPFDFVFLCKVEIVQLYSFEETAGKILWKSLFTASIRQSPSYPSISLYCKLRFVVRESHYMAWELLIEERRLRAS